jgi:hypothetical protein
MILAGHYTKEGRNRQKKKGKEEAHKKVITLMRIMKSPYS